MMMMNNDSIDNDFDNNNDNDDNRFDDECSYF